MTPRKMYVLFQVSFVLFFSTIALFFIVLVISTRNSHLSLVDFTGSLILIVSIICSGSVVLFCDIKIARLAHDWKKITKYEIGFFPQDKTDCEQLNKKYFPCNLEKAAIDANSIIDKRETARRDIEKHRRSAPVYAVKQNRVVWPSELPAIRANHKIELELHRKKTAELEYSYEELVSSAAKYHTEYLAWWDFLKKLGSYYEINLLPIDPKTQKTYDDPTKYREDVAKGEAKKIQELAALDEEIPAEKKSEGHGVEL